MSKEGSFDRFQHFSLKVLVLHCDEEAVRATGNYHNRTSPQG